MKVFYSIAFTLVGLFAFAQSNISLSLKDQSGNKIELATASLLKAQDSSFYKGAVSNTDGTINFPFIVAGDYRVFVQSLGYQDHMSAIFTHGNTTTQLPVITLKESAESLEAVELRVEKPVIQVQADKTVFNVQKSLAATGESGLNVLRKAPGVVVDNNNNLIVEGKGGVLIMIDGKRSFLTGTDLTSYLQSLQATDIEAIEIITQPSSKYDAEGTAGIINIKLVRDKTLGINGTVTSNLTVGKFARSNNSVNFNYRAKKSNLYGSYSNFYGRTFQFIDIKREQSNTIFDAESDIERNPANNNLRLGYDYIINKNHTIGAVVNGIFNKPDVFTSTVTPITPVGQSEPDQVLIASNTALEDSKYFYSNFNYKYQDSLGYSFNADLDYGRYDAKRSNDQPNSLFNGDRSMLISENNNFQNTPTVIDIYTGKVDYEMPALKGKIGVGAKISLIATDNEIEFYDVDNGVRTLDPNRSNLFSYDEQINAAYANYNRKWEKWSFQAGLRMENTISDGNLTSEQTSNNDRVKRNYTDFFPSGGLSYMANHTHSFSLNYSRRIQRPNYQTLNPFDFQLDELSGRRGNPFLQPQYTDVVKLSHTYKYRLTTALSYSRVNDFFAEITVAENNRESFIQTANVADQDVINLSISYPGKFYNWWNFYTSLNATHSSYISNSPAFVGVSQNTANIYMQHTFTVTPTFQVELSGWASTPSIWGGTFRTESLGTLDLAIQKKFFNERLTARAVFADMFYTQPWRASAVFDGVRINGNGGQDTRQFRFSLSYNFGSNEVKKARKRSTGIEEEKGRI